MANQIKAVMISALCISLFIGACSTAHSGNSITFDDPFSYCAAVGTIDSPDSQYIGPKLPDSIVKAMISKGIVSGSIKYVVINLGTFDTVIYYSACVGNIITLSCFVE